VKRPRLLATLASVLVVFDVVAAAERPTPTVTDGSGRVIKTFRPDGTIEASARPDPAARTAPAPVPSRPLRECAPAVAGEGRFVVRSSNGPGFSVDPCGQIVRARGGPAVSSVPATGATPAAPATIARMTTRGDYYSSDYTPAFGTIVLLGSADQYSLSDGTSWSSGAGSYYVYSSRFDHAEVSGANIHYVFRAPPSFLYQQVDYDSGEHSSSGTLGAVGTVDLWAVAGSTTAMMNGQALIVANEPANYADSRFNYFGAIVGSVVPFNQTYTLLGGQTWAPDTFTRSFQYTNHGEVDFAHPISVPPPVELKINGPALIPDQTAIQFKATVRYSNGVLHDVTATTSWEVAPPDIATLSSGLLSVPALSTPEETLLLQATYTEGSTEVSAEKTVVCRRGLTPSSDGSWPMYQADARHTGHLNLYLRPDRAALRWQRAVGAGRPLNPATAGDGKVFVTQQTYFEGGQALFALDAVDGHTLWSKDFGQVFSVNPPSYAYGMVYVQTGKDIGPTPPYLRALDGQTGETVFERTFGAQWESYLAPTVDGGNVYVNGGYYGGMYSFEAFSGEPRWFLSLPQYDKWTPAIANGRAYAYLGEYQPGLHVADKTTGALATYIPDPDFAWDGWSMNEAPVVAGACVAAIHDGRLLLFDPDQRSIRWQLHRNFKGQAAVGHKEIYAVDAGHLAVVDKATGADVWSWQPPEGALQGQMIVTESHVLASTASNVYAVDIRTRQSVWSYPAAGTLALAEGTLYVVSPSGVLTAITMPDVPPSPITNLEVAGPTTVVENAAATFHAIAHYEDGSAEDRTFVSTWSMEPTDYASLSGSVMTVGELLVPSEDVVVRARYTENDHTVEGTLGVKLKISVSLSDFVARCLAEAIAMKQRILGDLQSALVHERAAVAVDPQSRLREAIRREEAARGEIHTTIGLLKYELGPSTSPEPTPSPSPRADGTGPPPKE